MRTRQLNLEQLSKRIPPRPRDSHKGLFGCVRVVGGATGMVGAALLAARAALQLGAGSVHTVLLADDAPSVDLLHPELMLHQAGDQPELTPATVIALGCGMGTRPPAPDLLRQALLSTATLVLDADALNLLALHAELRTLLVARTAATVLTPHPGEAARLLGCSTQVIQQDRLAHADALRKNLRCSVVLKGADSVCATSDGSLYLNPSGNPGMSVAGMGDVLTGIIAALIAQGMTADDALLLGVYLHGAAGDALQQQHILLGMSATEVIAAARALLNHIVQE